MKKYKGLSTEVKDFNETKGIVTFAFSKFGIKDSDGDIITPGAFKKTIKENMARIKHLKFHDTRQSPGKILKIWEEGEYVLAESQLNQDTQIGRETFAEYKLGQITEHSHGFVPVKQGYSKEQNANIISEVKLYEVSSLLAWGANEFTPMVGMKDSDISDKLAPLVKELKAGNLSETEITAKIKELFMSIIADAPDNGSRTFSVTIISEHSEDEPSDDTQSKPEPKGINIDAIAQYFTK